MELLRLALITAVAACTVKVSHQGPDQQRLYNQLMSRYPLGPLVRPVQNDTQTLKVTLGLSLMQIMDVDERNQVLTTNAWLQLFWDDYYLQWDPEEFPGVTNVRLPENLIWRPDILLYNSADDRFDATYKTNILVNSSGGCSYIPPGIFKSTCSIDMRWFPFDLQRCDLKFGSWTYGGWSLDLQMMEPDVTGYTVNGEWHLVEVTGKKNERTYDCCPEPYPDVTFTVVMRRRTLYYGLNMLLPGVLISILALLVFMLPADSGEKISLGITVLLSLTVFMLLVAEIMPATSDSVPLIAQYFAATMVIVGVSVIATVVVLQYHHHNPNGGQMPKWTRMILLNWLAWFLRMKLPSEGGIQSAYLNNAQRSSLKNSELSANASASQYATKHDPNNSPKELDFAPRGHSRDEGEILLPKVPNLLVEAELTRILEEVRCITKRFHDQDQNQSLCEEWRFAAAVIDRFCLMAFAIFTILCTFAILMSMLNFDENISNVFN